MQLKYCFLASLFVVLMACNSQKYLPTEFPKDQIVFGNGGGFTGMVTTYVLQQNGQLFQESMDTTFDELAIIPKKECKLLFEQYRNLKVDTLELNNPGNMYRFLKLSNVDTTYHSVWGDGMVFPPDTVQAFYQSLLDMVREVREVEKVVKPDEKVEKVNEKAKEEVKDAWEEKRKKNE